MKIASMLGGVSAVIMLIHDGPISLLRVCGFCLFLMTELTTWISVEWPTGQDQRHELVVWVHDQVGSYFIM